MKKHELKELYPLMFAVFPDIVSVAQLRELLGISRRLAYQLINCGSISRILIHSFFLVTTNDFYDLRAKSFSQTNFIHVIIPSGLRLEGILFSEK